MEHGEIGNRVRLINYRGKGNIKKLTQLLRYLKYFDTEPIVMGDGHKEVRDAVEDFTRERLIKGPEYAIVRQNGNEFEDLFESNKLVKAMEKICASKLKFELTTEELEAKRTNRKAADILEDCMFNQDNGTRLDKMQLAKELALDIANEIKNNVPRKETKFEQEIKKILETIEKA
jgi:hypothetical protein